MNTKIVIALQFAVQLALLVLLLHPSALGAVAIASIVTLLHYKSTDYILRAMYDPMFILVSVAGASILPVLAVILILPVIESIASVWLASVIAPSAITYASNPNVYWFAGLGTLAGLLINGHRYSR